MEPWEKTWRRWLPSYMEMSTQLTRPQIYFRMQIISANCDDLKCCQDSSFSITAVHVLHNDCDRMGHKPYMNWIVVTPYYCCIVLIDSWLHKNTNKKFDPIVLGLDYKIQNSNSNEIPIDLVYLLIVWIKLVINAWLFEIQISN